MYLIHLDCLLLYYYLCIFVLSPSTGACSSVNNAHELLHSVSSRFPAAATWLYHCQWGCKHYGHRTHYVEQLPASTQARQSRWNSTSQLCYEFAPVHCLCMNLLNLLYLCKPSKYAFNSKTCCEDPLLTKVSFQVFVHLSTLLLANPDDVQVGCWYIWNNGSRPGFRYSSSRCGEERE